jgi:hypothetical protein
MTVTITEQVVAARDSDGTWVRVPLRVPDHLVPTLMKAGSDGIACILKGELLMQEVQYCDDVDSEQCWAKLLYREYLLDLVTTYIGLGNWVQAEAMIP